MGLNCSNFSKSCMCVQNVQIFKRRSNETCLPSNKISCIRVPMASADVGVSVNAVETVLKKAQSAPSSVSSGCTILRVVYRY